ncbi:acyl carrier protein [Streptomyces stramineus]|uniref:Acyl carrier protein n=1 Tax=Streptomyces stramineus TaxID=173861 RepID=A0ABN0ZQ31_9ACTN
MTETRNEVTRPSMTREEIVRALSDIVRDVTDLPSERIDENKAFVADLELDSLRMVQIVVAAEDRFGVTISEEKAWELRTVADAVTWIQDALEPAATHPEHRSRTAGPATSPATGDDR